MERIQLILKRICRAALFLIIVILTGCGNSMVFEDNGDSETGTFTVFMTENGLADNTVNDITVDLLRNGIWFATLNGISFYSNADSSWITYGAESDIPDMKVTSIVLDKTSVKVWAGTETGVAYFYNGRWTALEDMNGRYVTSIETFNDGSVWFGTVMGLEVLSVGEWKSYTAASGLSNDRITSITTDADGQIWVGTYNGISVFDGGKWSTFGSSVLPSTYVLAIYKSRNGSMWCGTSYNIAVYADESWKRYGTFDGVPAPGINDFIEDRYSVMWVATGGGAATLSGTKWSKLKLPALMEGQIVTSLAQDPVTGAVWIGTARGLVRYQPPVTE